MPNFYEAGGKAHQPGNHIGETMRMGGRICHEPPMIRDDRAAGWPSHLTAAYLHLEGTNCLKGNEFKIGGTFTPALNPYFPSSSFLVCLLYYSIAQRH